MTNKSVVRLERKNGVATITMDDPLTRNANSTPQMIEALVDAIREVNIDPSIGAIIFTGEGPAFSSGGEIKLMEAFQKMTPIEVRSYYIHHGIQRLTRAMMSIEPPTIAAVNGGAFGSGFGMALMCDFRIASTKASFTMNFAKLGILPGDGGAMFLLRSVGHQQAAKIMFTGEALSAQEALELGIVLELTTPESLLSRAQELAMNIASNPTQNLRQMKRLLQHAHTSEMEMFLEATVAMQALAHHTPEHWAGVERLKNKILGKSKT